MKKMLLLMSIFTLPSALLAMIPFTGQEAVAKETDDAAVISEALAEIEALVEKREKEAKDEAVAESVFPEMIAKETEEAAIEKLEALLAKSKEKRKVRMEKIEANLVQSQRKLEALLATLAPVKAEIITEIIAKESKRVAALAEVLPEIREKESKDEAQEESIFAEVIEKTKPEDREILEANFAKRKKDRKGRMEEIEANLAQSQRKLEALLAAVKGERIAEIIATETEEVAKLKMDLGLSKLAGPGLEAAYVKGLAEIRRKHAKSEAFQREAIDGLRARGEMTDALLVSAAKKREKRKAEMEETKAEIAKAKEDRKVRMEKIEANLAKRRRNLEALIATVKGEPIIK